MAQGNVKRMDSDMHDAVLKGRKAMKAVLPRWTRPWRRVGRAREREGVIGVLSASEAGAVLQQSARE